MSPFKINVLYIKKITYLYNSLDINFKVCLS